jgi:hypothetical protein
MNQSQDPLFTLFVVVGLGIAIYLHGKLALYIPLLVLFLAAAALPAIITFERGEFETAAVLAIIPAALIYWFIKK